MAMVNKHYDEEIKRLSQKQSKRYWNGKLKNNLPPEKK